MPLEIMSIIEDGCVIKYIHKRGLQKEYMNSKNKILLGNLKAVTLKKRKPYDKNVRQFELNKKYRALCYLRENNSLVIFEIYDHQ